MLGYLILLFTPLEMSDASPGKSALWLEQKLYLFFWLLW